MAIGKAQKNLQRKVKINEGEAVGLCISTIGCSVSGSLSYMAALYDPLLSCKNCDWDQCSDHAPMDSQHDECKYI